VAWFELERYKDTQDKDEVVARVGNDPETGPLFSEIMCLAVPKLRHVQGDLCLIEAYRT
jgi:hypothetical protein